MSWRIAGTYYSPCSCNVGCPCDLGEPDGDRGWCSAGALFAIQSGDVDGVDVSGAQVAFDIDWPRGMLSGNGVARVYFDPTMPQDKRAALEPVVLGQRGGVFEALASLAPQFLSSKEAPIRIYHTDEGIRVTVGDYGEMIVNPLRGPSGDITKIFNMPGAFTEPTILGHGNDSYWRDPEMRQWESGGHGEQGDFDWSG